MCDTRDLDESGILKNGDVYDAVPCFLSRVVTRCGSVFASLFTIASVGGLTSWVCAAPSRLQAGHRWLDSHAAFVSTIYLVDDEASIRNSLRRLLNVHGITVEVYASAESFLVVAGHLINGCLVLDVNMPGLTGLELLNRLRSKNNWHLPAPHNRARRWVSERTSYSGRRVRASRKAARR